MKFPPNSSATHVPLLQLIKSQILIGGLGLGEIVRTKDDVVSIGTSQNIPVNPGKHSQVTKSLSSSMHSPLVQLMKLHSETLAVGVGDIRTELEGAAVVGKPELIVTVDWKEEGKSTNSELEIEKMNDDEETVEVGKRISQSSPVYPVSH